jgi:hypothetical protein
MPLRLRSIPTLLLALSVSAAITVGCGDDKGNGEEHSGTEPAICQEISSVCHDADGGSGMAHDCHEQAHAGDAAVCEMIHDECIAFCTGGTGTETGTSMTTMTSTTDATTDAPTSSESSTDESTTEHHDETTTEHNDESSTAADHGTDTGAPDSCDELGSGCHDNKTPEGMECHDIGHAGDVAACDKAYDMCAKICGL